MGDDDDGGFVLNIAGAGDDAGDDSRARMGNPRRRTVLRPERKGRHRGWAGSARTWSGPPPRRASAETKEAAEVTASAYRKQGGAARAAEAPRPRTGRPRTRTSPPTLWRRRLPAHRGTGAFAGGGGRGASSGGRGGRDRGRGSRDGRGARGGRGSSAVELAAREGDEDEDDEAFRPGDWASLMQP